MIAIMPESTKQMLAIRASGTLTENDYHEEWLPALEKIINEYEVANVVFFMDENFVGWDMKGMWEDAKFGYKHRNDFARLAIVGGPNWVRWGVRLSENMLDCEVKTYEPGQLKEAVAWASVVPKCRCETCGD